MSKLTERLERELEDAKAEERRSEEMSDNLRDLLKARRDRDNLRLAWHGVPTNDDEGDDAA